MAGLHPVLTSTAIARLGAMLTQWIAMARGAWIGISLGFWVVAVVLANVARIRRYNPKIWYWLMHLLWMIPLSIAMVDGLPVWVGIVHPATALPPTLQ